MPIDVDRLTAESEGPGKFEGEGPETLHYYERVGDGDGDVVQSCEHGGGSLVILPVDDEERAAFDFAADVVSVALQEDSQGFVTSWTLTAEEERALRVQVEQEEQGARDYEEREALREIEGAVGPVRWTVRFCAHSGCSPSPLVFESLEDARECFDASLAQDREDGFMVDFDPIGQSPNSLRAEIEDPEDAARVSDRCGILTLSCNAEERQEEIERRLERFRESF
jgi:hypothetical protein